MVLSNRSTIHLSIQDIYIQHTKLAQLKTELAFNKPQRKRAVWISLDPLIDDYLKELVKSTDSYESVSALIREAINQYLLNLEQHLADQVLEQKP